MLSAALLNCSMRPCWSATIMALSVVSRMVRVSSLALTQLVLVLTQASLGSLPCLDLGSKQIPDLGKLGRAPFICAPGAVNMRQA